MHPVSRGWSNYCRIGVSKETFRNLDTFRYHRAQRYMKRRPPRKSGRWRTERYWGRTLGRQDRWVFQEKQRQGTLRKFAWTKLVRHRLVPTTSSPDAPTRQEYWQQRRAKPQVTSRVAGHSSRGSPVSAPSVTSIWTTARRPPSASAKRWSRGPRPRDTPDARRSPLLHRLARRRAAAAGGRRVLGEPLAQRAGSGCRRRRAAERARRKCREFFLSVPTLCGAERFSAGGAGARAPDDPEE